MVSGPYRSGAAGAEQRAENLAALESMMPLSLALADRCDACLRVGGPSTGADEEAARFRASGRPVYAQLEDVPGV